MNRNGRGRCSVGRMAGNGLSSAGGGGERERGTDTKREGGQRDGRRETEEGGRYDLCETARKRNG